MLRFTKANTFVLSRWDATARQGRMRRRLAHFGMAATLWPAITPETPLTEDQQPRFFEPSLTPGARACAHSHTLIWRYLIDTHLPYALILEDDTRFARDWQSALAAFDDTQSWEAIFLGASEAVSPPGAWVPAHEQYSTGAYVLTRRGAEWLRFGFEEPGLGSADWMTTRLQKMHPCFTRFPWLAVQEFTDSAITAGDRLAADRAKAERLLAEVGVSLTDGYI